MDQALHGSSRTLWFLEHSIAETYHSFQRSHLFDAAAAVAVLADDDVDADVEEAAAAAADDDEGVLP